MSLERAKGRHEHASAPPPPATIRTMNDDAANLAERAPDFKAMRRLLLIAVIVGIVDDVHLP